MERQPLGMTVSVIGKTHADMKTKGKTRELVGVKGKTRMTVALQK